MVPICSSLLWLVAASAAFERRFLKVHVQEPSVLATIDILQGLKKKYEEHHGAAPGYPATAAKNGGKCPRSGAGAQQEERLAMETTRDKEKSSGKKIPSGS